MGASIILTSSTSCIPYKPLFHPSRWESQPWLPRSADWRRLNSSPGDSQSVPQAESCETGAVQIPPATLRQFEQWQMCPRRFPEKSSSSFTRIFTAARQGQSRVSPIIVLCLQTYLYRGTPLPSSCRSKCAVYGEAACSCYRCMIDY